MASDSAVSVFHEHAGSGYEMVFRVAIGIEDGCGDDATAVCDHEARDGGSGDGAGDAFGEVVLPVAVTSAPCDVETEAEAHDLLDAREVRAACVTEGERLGKF